MATYKTKLCSKWNKNLEYDKCLYGKDCTFAHGQHELRCVFYQKGECKFNDNCFLIHEMNNVKIVDNLKNITEEKKDSSDFEKIKQDIFSDLKNNKFIENVKQDEHSIKFNINVDDVKKNIIDWVSDDDDIKSEEYKTDPFLETDKKIQIFENNNIAFDNYIISLKEHIKKIEINKDKLSQVDNMLWKKLLLDLQTNENILEI